MSYEADLTRIEMIVTELDRDDLALEHALQLFEEGVARLRSAAAALVQVEGRVRVLLEQSDGSFALTDLGG